MSLNSEQMLPARVRKMRQMEDLLNVEDIILAEIERILMKCMGRQRCSMRSWSMRLG